MSIKTFTGLLEHKNPICPDCHLHCFSLYQGGKKERLGDLYICRNCQSLYELPDKKKCKFTEVQT